MNIVIVTLKLRHLPLEAQQHRICATCHQCESNSTFQGRAKRDRRKGWRERSCATERVGPSDCQTARAPIECDETHHPIGDEQTGQGTRQEEQCESESAQETECSPNQNRTKRAERVCPRAPQWEPIGQCEYIIEREKERGRDNVCVRGYAVCDVQR